MFMSKKRYARITYAIIAIVLFLTEVYIALYVNDSFIRPFGGDILVTLLLGDVIRIFVLKKPKILALYIFVFSIFVELMQYIDIVKLLHLDHIQLLSVLVGRSFSFIDIVCYGVGCIAFVLVEKTVNSIFALR